MKKLVLVLLAALMLLALCACTETEPAGDGSSLVPADTADPSAFSASGGVVSYPGALQGIDVSEHQGEIDWARVKADGIEFAILRLGYRGTGEKGSLNVDARFEENYLGAQEAGLPVGVYFYSQALSNEEADAEAAFVREVLAGRSLDLPVFFDWEESSGRTKGASKNAVTDYALRFCDALREDGYEAGAYFYASLGSRLYLETLLEGDFWLSQPGPRPSVPYAVQFWQYSFEGRVDGISTVVDRDLMYEKGDNTQ